MIMVQLLPRDELFQLWVAAAGHGEQTARRGEEEGQSCERAFRCSLQCAAISAACRCCLLCVPCCWQRERGSSSLVVNSQHAAAKRLATRLPHAGLHRTETHNWKRKTFPTRPTHKATGENSHTAQSHNVKILDQTTLGANWHVSTVGGSRDSLLRSQ